MSAEKQTEVTRQDTFLIAQEISERLRGLTVSQACTVIDFLKSSIEDAANRQPYNNSYFEKDAGFPTFYSGLKL